MCSVREADHTPSWSGLTPLWGMHFPLSKPQHVEPALHTQPETQKHE